MSEWMSGEQPCGVKHRHQVFLLSKSLGADEEKGPCPGAELLWTEGMAQVCQA